MTRISNILIPVDFSHALRTARHNPARRSLRFDAKLTVTHIIPSVAAFNYAFPYDPGDFQHKAFVETRRLLPAEIPEAYFFFNDTATTEIYTLSLHDALPI